VKRAIIKHSGDDDDDDDDDDDGISTRNIKSTRKAIRAAQLRFQKENDAV